MYCWRITKYNPKNRDFNGAYLKKEWISYSEIGKVFENKKFMVEDYLKIENAYIQAIILFMECLNINYLRIVALQKKIKPEKNEFYSFSMINAYNSFKKRQLISKELVIIIAKLALRENLWCKLEAEDMYVHFGYDYYMYIGSKNICKDAISKIEKSGLYAEAFESPYS